MFADKMALLRLMLFSSTEARMQGAIEVERYLQRAIKELVKHVKSTGDDNGAREMQNLIELSDDMETEGRTSPSKCC